MTDPHNNHGHDGAHGGGHEIDAPPTRELFNIVWGLGLLTLLSLVTCVQLFNNQARDLTAERGKEGSFVLEDYRKDAETRTRGSGTDTVTDATGKVVGRYNYIPLASARELILGKPEKLGAFAPPPGWMHPDDVAAGGQGAQGTPPAMPQPPPAGDPAAVGGAPVGPDGQPVAPTGAGVPGTDAQPSPPSQPVGAPDPTNTGAGQAPGGTPEPVGTKSPVGAPAGAPAPVNKGPESDNRPATAPGQGAPEGAKNAQPDPAGAAK